MPLCDFAVIGRETRRSLPLAFPNRSGPRPGRRCREPALNQRLCRRLQQPRFRSSLRHFAGAGAADIFGAARHDHLQLRRDHVEPFGDILADAMLEAAAALAGLVLDIDDGLFARQVRRQRAAIDLPRVPAPNPRAQSAS